MLSNRNVAIRFLLCGWFDSRSMAHARKAVNSRSGASGAGSYSRVGDERTGLVCVPRTVPRAIGLFPFLPGPNLIPRSRQDHPSQERCVFPFHRLNDVQVFPT